MSEQYTSWEGVHKNVVVVILKRFPCCEHLNVSEFCFLSKTSRNNKHNKHTLHSQSTIIRAVFKDFFTTYKEFLDHFRPKNCFLKLQDFLGFF